MKHTKVYAKLVLFCSAVVFFVACGKVKNPVPMGDAGQTLVKFIEGGYTTSPGNKLINIELNTTPLTVEAVDLRRDIPNSKELQKGMTIVIKNDAGAVSTVEPEAIALPDGSYTMSSNVTTVGDEFEVTMAPGQFAAPISFTIADPSQLDGSKTYGMGFTIYSVDADGKILDEQKSYVVILSSKNKYDGIYRLYGGFSRADQPTFTGVSESARGYYEPYYLITSGPASVDACINTAQYGIANSQIIWVNSATPGYTFFTGVAPRINVDKNTNGVTVTPGVAITPPSVNFTQSAAELADSKYYPNGIASAPNTAGKATIVAHFRWSSGGIDRFCKDTFVYRSPR